MARNAAAVLALWALAALVGPALVPDPDRIDLARILAAPGQGLWLGADDLGRDIYARLVGGARVSLAVAVAVVLVAGTIGTAIGLLAGWAGGAVDLACVRVMEVFQAFPGLLLAIALAGALGPGAGNAVVALTAVGWVGFARLARAQTRVVRSREHVLAAIALGTRTHHIVLRHVLPLVAAPLVVEATFGFAGAIVGEAGLSFLGLGVQPPAASWGTMIRDGSAYMLVAPHFVLGPALAMAIVVLAVNLLGDRLRDALDVRTRH
ncbi:MAG: ABC transporter permease [Gammaproteobacteria bacterium]